MHAAAGRRFDARKLVGLVVGLVGVAAVATAANQLNVKVLLELKCGQLGGAPDVRATQVGLGPTPGNAASRTGTGSSAGSSTGAAGGSHGGLGGTGGRSEDLLGPTSAPPNDSFDLVGGSGGGGGCDSGQALPASYRGGAGGAAIQLIAGTEVLIDSGGIVANGCSGVGTRSSNLDLRVGGAGGGAGGFIWIEAPTIRTTGPTSLLANGGAGAGHGGEPVLTNMNATPTPGGAATLCTGAGGAGGAGETIDGAPGANAPQPIHAECTQGVGGGGGGGGAAGRIVVFTEGGTGIQHDGTVPVVSPTAAAFRQGQLTFVE